MSKPITKIIINLQSQDALKDIWKLFDYIINKMEELGSDGMPKVDAQGRKRFRVEVQKAPEGMVLEVFSRWVTLLVPEMVPATPNLIQRVVGPPTLTNVDAVEQAKFTTQEEKERAQEEERKATIKARRVEMMAKARAARCQGPAKGRSHKKKRVEGV